MLIRAVATVNTKYGWKIILNSPFQAKDDIKELDWDKFHPTWSGSAWLIDLKQLDSLYSVFQKLGHDLIIEEPVKKEYEKITGFKFVLEKDKIQLLLSENEFKVKADTPVLTILEDELCYEDENKEYMPAYISGDWDGYVRLFGGGIGPIGLFDRARKVLDEYDYEYEVHDNRKESGKKTNFKWHAYDLRAYQKYIIKKVLINGGGIISLPTASGKTVTALKLIHKLQMPTLITVHTKQLLYQWEDEIKYTFQCDCGLIGDKNWKEDDITVATVQTLLSKGINKLKNRYDIWIPDECHITSAADKYFQLGKELKAVWRVGLSATPWRKSKGESMKIEGAVGGLVKNVPASFLIKKGYLAEPYFQIIENPRKAFGFSYADVYKRYIEDNQLRNMNIAEKALEMIENGYKVFISVRRISQGKALKKLCGGVFLQGKDDMDLRKQTIEDFENGKINPLISTLLKEGANIPSMSCVILADGLKSDINTIQTIGRVLRQKEGSNHGYVIDVRDTGKYIGHHFYERQKTMKEYYGKYYQENKDYDI